MLVFMTMLVAGIVIGFIGAGGAGVMIAILTTIFGVPVHTALGTSLLTMFFTSITGSYSHIQEKNVVFSTGTIIGLFGAGGAFIGSPIAQMVPEGNLKWLTAGALTTSTILLWFRIFTQFGVFIETWLTRGKCSSHYLWLTCCVIGAITGTVSGLFGIGAAPFIQVALLIFFGLTIQEAAGTTMFIIIPIAFIGGFGYYTIGYLDVLLFVKVVTGSMIGSYIGAKFTRWLHPTILKIAMVTSPIAGAILLLLGS